MGSNFGDASNHTCNNLPMIVAEVIATKRILYSSKSTPLCNSLTSELLHKHDIDAGAFGSSNADLGLLKS